MLVADAGTFAFRHEVARLAVEAELGEGKRRDLHGRIVAALMARADIDPARIAHHADASGDDTAAAHYAMKAALQASARAAHREAVRHGERAIALRNALSADEVAALKTRVAFSLVSSARADEAVALATEAVTYWRAASDELKEADALTVLASALGSSGRTTAGMEAMARSIDLLESHPPGPELAAAYARLTSSYMLARDRDTAISWGERAIALASELGDPILLGRALVETGIADVMDERFEGLARINQAIELGRQHGLPSLIGARVQPDRFRLRRAAPLRPGRAGADRGGEDLGGAELRDQPPLRAGVARSLPFRSGAVERCRDSHPGRLGRLTERHLHPLRRLEHAGVVAGPSGERRRVAGARRGVRDRRGDRASPAPVAVGGRPRRGRLARGGSGNSRRVAGELVRARHAVSSRGRDG